MARPPESWVSWFSVSRWRYQNRNRLATTPAMTIRLPLFWAFCGVRPVVGLITGGRLCCGTAAFAPCFLIRCAGFWPCVHYRPAHRREDTGVLHERLAGPTSDRRTGNYDPALDDYQLASALVREAGQLALLMRQGGLTAQQKTSISDVVTAADHAAEAYVLEQLQRCRPEDGILGEEGAAVPAPAAGPG